MYQDGMEADAETNISKNHKLFELFKDYIVLKNNEYLDFEKIGIVV